MYNKLETLIDIQRFLMSILLFKIIMAFLIIATALAGGYFAFKIKDSKKSALYFSLGNTFAAGIFLGAGLIHMLPVSLSLFAKDNASIESSYCKK